jgi:hypothetical protein
MEVITKMKKTYEKPDLNLIQMKALEKLASLDPSMSGTLEDEEF